jgi:hypothetical protein
VGGDERYGRRRVQLPRNRSTEGERQSDRRNDPSFNFIGFEWNVVAKTVVLQLAKLEKYLGRLRHFASKAAVSTLPQVQELFGTMSHLCYLFPHACLYTRAILAFQKSFGDKQFKLHRPRGRRQLPVEGVPYTGVIGEAQYWCDLLKGRFEQYVVDGAIGCVLRPERSPFEFDLVGDASNTGVGIIVDGVWEYWPTVEGWKSEDETNIDLPEAITVELGILLLVRVHADEFEAQRAAGAGNLVAFSDNMAVVDGWASQKNSNRNVNDTFRCVSSPF